MILQIISSISTFHHLMMAALVGVEGDRDGPSEVTLERSRHLVPQLASSDTIGVVHVSTPSLVLSAVPLLLIAFMSHRFDLGLSNQLIIGIIRSFMQLMILGLILHPIFVLGMDWPWLVGLCELGH